MNTSQLLGYAMLGYFFTTLANVVYAVSERQKLRIAASAIAAIAFVAHTAAITSRIVESQRPPLTNTYETLLLFAWVLAILAYLWQDRYRLPHLGMLSYLVTLLILGAASLPQISADIEPLLPSLKSNWLIVHVLLSFVAYAAFAMAFVCSVFYIVIRAAPKRLARFQGDLPRLDQLSYQAIMVGFPLFTVGIVTGAIWANLSWGQYWSWDPKESWALVTWIIYSICLHLRHTSSWKGRWAAWASILGFVFVIFTYLGVNYFFEGLHSYG